MIVEEVRTKTKEGFDKFYFKIFSEMSKKEYGIAITFDNYKNIIFRSCTCKWGTIDGSLPKPDLKKACKHINEAIDYLLKNYI